MKGICVWLLVSSWSGATWARTINLRQRDFDQGTYFADEQGATYRLAEDITFSPPGTLSADSPETFLFPNIRQAPYNFSSFRLGFFAALIVSADDVTIDLNGHALAQSRAHSNMQRFFALIELSNSPFQPNKGPAAFSDGTGYIASKRVTIKNGKLGRSAHHSIHGSDNVDIVISQVEMTGFEVAGISLNNVTGLTVSKCNIHGRETVVESNGALSNAIFLLQSISQFISLDDSFDSGTPASLVRTTQAKLRAAVFDFLSTGKDWGRGLFKSRAGGIPDASLLNGIMIHHTSAHIGGFLQSQPAAFSSGIRLEDVTISDLILSPTEIGGLAAANGVVERDPAGAVFDVDGCSNPATNAYFGNPLCDAQLALANYKLRCAAASCSSMTDPRQAGLLNRISITQGTVEWSLGTISFNQLLARGYKVLFGGDIMFHAMKGVIGLKLDGVADVKAENVVIKDLINVGGRASKSRLAELLNEDYVYQGYASRAVAISSSVQVDGSFTVGSISSSRGSAVCVDTLFEFDDVSFKLSREAATSATLPQTTPTGGRGSGGYGAESGTGDDDDNQVGKGWVEGTGGSRRRKPSWWWGRGL